MSGLEIVFYTGKSYDGIWLKAKCNGCGMTGIYFHRTQSDTRPHCSNCGSNEVA